MARTAVSDRPPPRPVDHLLAPLNRFIHTEAAGGILLMAATLTALVWANSPWAEAYHGLWGTKVTVGFGQALLSKPLLLWINDGLMAVFFFTVGLEIKREILVGELSSGRQALLPLAAAVGGMLLPAAIYLAVNPTGPAAGGWGIPMATDIAFALGILSLLGRRAPVSLKIFLTALAIADDLGAVLIIALFYTSQISLPALAAAGGLLAMLVAANLLGVRSPVVYWLLGVTLWLAVLLSGVHATVGGVLAAMTIPASQRLDGARLVKLARGLMDRFEMLGSSGDGMLRNPEQHAVLEELKEVRLWAEPPLMRLESAHHPLVAYGVMPVFALANAGVSLPADIMASLLSPVSLGIAAGLVLGKQAGVMAVVWLCLKLGWGQPLPGTGWRHLYGASCLCGIGFTMSIFVASLALDDPAALDTAKMGIIAASIGSGILGWLVLAGARPPDPTASSA